MQFEIATPANSQLVVLNDNSGNAPPEEIVTARDPKATYWAINAYARRNGLDPAYVGYSVRLAN